MDAELFSFLFNALLLIGVIVALKDRSRINVLLQKIHHLQKVLDLQAKQIQKLNRKITETSGLSDGHISPEKEALEKESQTTELEARIEAGEIEQAAQVNTAQSTGVNIPFKNVTNNPTNSMATTGFRFEDLLKGNGLFWIGAVVLAIGGVFLAKYSIEAGLFPPGVRVILGSIFGILLVVSAEGVNHYKEKLNVNTPYISAALASGGVITCFAMALVSFDYYRFVTPNMAFALLAIIALVSTYLALRYGPVLAGIGIIGSYAVPVLVSTDSNNVLALLLYVSFVSLSAVWVAECVKQKWLWWLSFIGHYVWFMVAIVIGGKTDYTVILLFAGVSLYLYVLAGLLGWRLTHNKLDALPLKLLLMPRKEQAAIILVLFLSAVHLTMYAEFTHLVWASLVLSALVMVFAYKHSALDSWPFMMLGFGLYAFSLMSSITDYNDNLFPFSGKYLFIQLSVIVAMLFSLFMSIRYHGRHAYLLLFVVSPVSLYGFSYITAEQESDIYLYPVWVLEMLLIGLIASIGAIKLHNKPAEQLRQVTYLILANSMLTLSLTMLLSASTLTLALAAQVASMSYLSWKYKVKIPDWLFKAALVVVVTRLTCAPWLADYKDETIINVHWTLIVYPLVLTIIWFATKYNPSKQLNIWFVGVIMHVLALFITTETSYQLIGKYPNLFDLSFQEAVLLSLNWLILAGVYMWRGQLSKSMERLYRIGGLILISGAALIHLDVSLFNSPFIERHFVGEGPLNWIVLQWLVPSVILAIIAVFKLAGERLNSVLWGASILFVVFFVNGQIRNLFNDGYLYWETPLQQAELYTYSIVWLIISTMSVFAGQHLGNKTLINAGFVGLAIVILKAFGVDMSHLEGLLRALSFIGLGLCLVGVGWLFQKMQDSPEGDKAV